MREYLFRGKRIDNGEWVTGFYFQRIDTLGKIIESIIIEDAYSQVSYGQMYLRSDIGKECWRVDPATVGQYTGLKGKNGNKIFDGDIMRLCQAAHPCLVYWDGRGWAWMQNRKRRDIDLTREVMQIIGNIHDNPELL